MSYFKQWKESKGISIEDIKKNWEEVRNSEADREGTGATLQIWIAKRRSRLKDKTHYQSQAYNEGAKTLKHATEKKTSRTWSTSP